MASEDGWRRRARAADALHEWLAEEHASDWALVIGDVNDDIDVSTYRSRCSPFANLVADPMLRFTTDALGESAQPPTVSWSATIDHHLATARLARRFVAHSAIVVPANDWERNYARTPRDHFPR
ncbi:MAG: hypothetical protein FJ137_05750 [Deltaproteobacteria bacterium]|nr:hypothetical protein [Deltaproteobacteria bacterium]